MEFLAKDLFCQTCLDFLNAIRVEIAGLPIRTETDHVQMRVVGFIVKGGVPAELLHGDLHSLRHLWSKPGEQFPPLHCVIVAQPCGILPAQRDDGEPDVAGMMCHCISDLRQDQRFICVSEQRMAPSPLGARPAGDIVHIVFPFGDLVSVVL